MYRIRRPKKDSTIYSDRPCKNAGLDETLEMRTLGGPIPEAPCDPDYPFGSEYDQDELYPEIPDSSLRAQKSRLLLYFELEDIIEEAEMRAFEGSGITGSEYDVFFRMYSTRSQRLPIDYSLFVHPLTQGPPNFGGGFPQGRDKSTGSDVSSEGVSWIFRSLVNQVKWDNPGGDFLKYSPQDSSQKVFNKEDFSFESPDVFMSIKKVFDYWREFGNSGMLVKFNEGVESLTSDTFRVSEDLTIPAEINFFSSLTHTVYSPELLFGFDDHEWFVTGSDQIFYDENLEVRATNLDDSYQEGETSRIRVRVADEFPEAEKKYINTPDYFSKKRSPNYLPEGSLQYSIIDKIAGKTIIPFSEFSQLSFDADGYYFDIDFTNFYPERYYELRFRYEDPIEGFVEVFDSNQKFKVEK